MEAKSKKQCTTQIVKEIKRRTRRKFTAICRKYAIHSNNYFKWSKEFKEAGKRRLSGDTLLEATRDGRRVFNYLIFTESIH